MLKYDDISKSNDNLVFSNNKELQLNSLAMDIKTPNPDTLSVSDALLIAKTGLETIKVRIIGEISELSNKPGYKAVYFTIKDKKSSLPCLMWKNKFISNCVDIKIGSLVEICGKFSLYAAKGRMNFDVDSILLAGEGQLRMQVAMLAKRLEKEGLTSIDKKKIIPIMPMRIGLVTSPRGAVVHDFIRTLNRRMPIAKIVFAGCPVEGNDAAHKIINAIDCLQKAKCDVICICRGGGSFEDLMPFNDENLARKIADSYVPVVTGIGHEPDTTIADLVSDFRASTPTGAAEAVSFNSKDMINELIINFKNLKTKIFSKLNNMIDKLNSIASRPIFMDGTKLFASEFQNIDYNHEKLYKLLNNFSNKYNHQISLYAAKLHDKSPLIILGRGYSVVSNMQGKIIKSIEQVEIGNKINVMVSDGLINVNVESKEKKEIDSI